jgi:ankyrin repeat protein
VSGERGLSLTRDALVEAQGYVECVRELLEGGVDPELRDLSGRTAYDIAVNKKSWDVASLLKPAATEVHERRMR